MSLLISFMNIISVLQVWCFSLTKKRECAAIHLRPSSNTKAVQLTQHCAMASSNISDVKSYTASPKHINLIIEFQYFSYCLTGLWEIQYWRQLVFSPNRLTMFVGLGIAVSCCCQNVVTLWFRMLKFIVFLLKVLLQCSMTANAIMASVLQLS